MSGLFPVDKRQLVPDSELTQVLYEPFSKKKASEYFAFFLHPRHNEPADEAKEE